ncbi:hypothetical protein HDF08_002841 [Edaphobacter lichenicola]|uniref:Uncharacterized protein n=1 Tax=Tunturiibacter lichenicola TaxID=2051959 RepID=A0A852VI20_9BACT|nr:hypothetical protein [Edaphobacter lichenicola]
MEIPAGFVARHGFGLTNEFEKMQISRCYAILKERATDSETEFSMCRFL